MNKTRNCSSCDAKFPKVEMLLYCLDLPDNGASNLWYCEDCYYEHYFTCDNCSHTKPMEDCHYLEQLGITICNSCFSTEYFKCTDCQDIAHNDESYETDTGYFYCSDCIWNDHSTCGHCDRISHMEDMSYSEIDDNAYCNSCYQEQSIIKSYSYKPTPIFHTAKNERSYMNQETREKRLVFGFELEVENEGNFTHNDCAEILKEIGGDLLYFKEDSSISNGFEIVSHPMTYAYFKENKDMLKKLLKKAVSLGLRSYNTSTCGLHISLCRKAFSHSHYLKFVNFFNSTKNHGILKAISQRQESQLHWCALTKFSNKNELIKFSKLKNNGQSLDRYLALNIRNKSRLEVRLFRGTLKLDSFLKGFECVFAIFDFCKQMSFADLEISSSKDISKTDEKIKSQNLDSKGTSIAQITPNLIEKRYFNTFIHKNRKQFRNLDLFLDAKYSYHYNCDKEKNKIKHLNKILHQNKGGCYSCV